MIVSFEQVCRDGASDERSLANAGCIEHAGNIAGVLLHEGRSFTNLGIAVPAQIGENQPVARFERRCHWVPELMMTRTRMEKNDRRSVPTKQIEDLGVV